MPPIRAVTRAATGRRMANGNPIIEKVAAMLSTPVWGVAMRNDVEAAREAPLRRNATAVGSTPHEHRGNGTPKAAAVATERSPVPAR